MLGRVHHYFLAWLSTFLVACAGSGGVVETESSSVTAAGDPLEAVNRGVFAFNRVLDRYTLRPLATGYKKATPGFVRRGVGNFFTNLTTPLTIVNQLLQGKGRAALSDTGRLLLNSTVGVGGLFDPASAAGLDLHSEDFGQTLAVWGVADGPYVVLPLLGPRTLRDALATPADFVARPLTHYDNTSTRDKLLVLEAISIRARLLSADSLIEESADPYATVRDAYQQNRRYRIFDGSPPDANFYDDYIEEPTDEQ